MKLEEVDYSSQSLLVGLEQEEPLPLHYTTPAVTFPSLMQYFYYS